MRALRAFRSCVVQQSTDHWTIYVQADPVLIAELVATVRLSDCNAVDESELAAVGITG
jgi:hypothetical protein